MCLFGNCVIALSVLGCISITTFVSAICPADLPWTHVRYMANPVDCNKYYICFLGAEIQCDCGENMVWDQDSKVCCMRGSHLDKCTTRRPEIAVQIPAKAAELCLGNPTAKFAHPTNCARYYDCSQPTRVPQMSEDYERECIYPNSFSTTLLQCDHYLNVNCGSRAVKISPCDYGMNLCVRAHCVPCNRRQPDCKGLQNGRQVWKGRERTKYFVICENERVVDQGECPTMGDMQFVLHESKKVCVEKSYYDG